MEKVAVILLSLLLLGGRIPQAHAQSGHFNYSILLKSVEMASNIVKMGSTQRIDSFDFFP